MRTFAVWCPDWPATAAAIDVEAAAHQPLAVVTAGRISTVTAPARAAGIAVGVRVRDAQARCPDLIVTAADPERDARTFEPIVVALQERIATIEVVRPGLCVAGAKGPARFYGGEYELARMVVEHLTAETGLEVWVGIADSLFAAALAAQRSTIVPVGGTAEFLAGFDLTVLNRPTLADTLRRLGVHTLGAFAALAAADVANRFGADAAAAHRLARGQEPRPLPARLPTADLSVTSTFDPPLERVQAALIGARALAEQFQTRLFDAGYACHRLAIEATTADGQQLVRVWRYDGVLDVDAITDRVRWQLETWLARGGAGALATLGLAADDAIKGGSQAGLWGGPGPADEAAGRAMTRVQALLGEDGIATATPAGGRGLAHVELVPWGQLTDERAARPWPGGIPGPHPSIVYTEPRSAQLLDNDDRPVVVSGRYLLSAEPVHLVLDKAAPVEVAGWAGPWPTEEHWWTGLRRRAWLQIVPVSGDPVLLVAEAGCWWVAAVYQ